MSTQSNSPAVSPRTEAASSMVSPCTVADKTPKAAVANMGDHVIVKGSYAKPLASSIASVVLVAGSIFAAILFAPLSAAALIACAVAGGLGVLGAATGAAKLVYNFVINQSHFESTKPSSCSEKELEIKSCALKKRNLGGPLSLCFQARKLNNQTAEWQRPITELLAEEKEEFDMLKMLAKVKKTEITKLEVKKLFENLPSEAVNELSERELRDEKKAIANQSKNIEVTEDIVIHP